MIALPFQLLDGAGDRWPRGRGTREVGVVAQHGAAVFVLHVDADAKGGEHLEQQAEGAFGFDLFAGGAVALVALSLGAHERQIAKCTDEQHKGHRPQQGRSVVQRRRRQGVGLLEHPQKSHAHEAGDRRKLRTAATVEQRAEDDVKRKRHAQRVAHAAGPGEQPGQHDEVDGGVQQQFIAGDRHVAAGAHEQHRVHGDHHDHATNDRWRRHKGPRQRDADEHAEHRGGQRPPAQTRKPADTELVPFFVDVFVNVLRPAYLTRHLSVLALDCAVVDGRTASGASP